MEKLKLVAILEIDGIEINIKGYLEDLKKFLKGKAGFEWSALEREILRIENEASASR